MSKQARSRSSPASACFKVDQVVPVGIVCFQRSVDQLHHACQEVAYQLPCRQASRELWEVWKVLRHQIKLEVLQQRVKVSPCTGPSAGVLIHPGVIKQAFQILLVTIHKIAKSRLAVQQKVLFSLKNM